MHTIIVVESVLCSIVDILSTRFFFLLPPCTDHQNQFFNCESITATTRTTRPPSSYSVVARMTATLIIANTGFRRRRIKLKSRSIRCKQKDDVTKLENIIINNANVTNKRSECHKHLLLDLKQEIEELDSYELFHQDIMNAELKASVAAIRKRAAAIVRKGAKHRVDDAKAVIKSVCHLREGLELCTHLNHEVSIHEQCGGGVDVYHFDPSSRLSGYFVSPGDESNSIEMVSYVLAHFGKTCV